MKNGTNKVSGIPILGGEMMLTQGDAFFLDPTNGSDSNEGTKIDRAKAGLETASGALALTTTNKNEVIYYLGGSTSLTLVSNLVYNKSYTHFIGAAVAPARIGQRTRIFHNFNNSAGTAVIQISKQV